MMELHKDIYLTVKNWIGYRELPGNMGFHNKQFQQLMFAVGMQPGQAWCAWMVKAAWTICFVHEEKQVRKELNAIMNGGAVATFNSFENSDYLVNKEPAPGAAVFWQKYRGGEATWMGHAGICTPYKTKTLFGTIEGNTNKDGGREGYMVAEKKRGFTWESNNGLRLLGFVHPIRKEKYNPTIHELS